MGKITLHLTEHQADFLATVMHDYSTATDDWTVARDARNVLALLQVAQPARRQRKERA